jgi:5-methylcytosine-specific restriction endonuclease McrA
MKGGRIYKSTKTAVLSTRKITISEKRKAIPKALREEVWRRYIGTTYESKCTIGWCTNKITPFDYEVGHNIPHSKGGLTTIENLRPICSRCNKSMSDTYSIDEWNTMGKKQEFSNEAVPVTTTGCWCFKSK